MWGLGREKMKQDGIRRETNHKRLNLSKQTEISQGETGREKVVVLWTLGRVCAMLSAVKCVNLVIHRPVPLGIKMYYMFIKNKKFKKKTFRTNKPFRNI